MKLKRNAARPKPSHHYNPTFLKSLDYLITINNMYISFVQTYNLTMYFSTVSGVRSNIINKSGYILTTYCIMKWLVETSLVLHHKGQTFSMFLKLMKSSTYYSVTYRFVAIRIM